MARDAAGRVVLITGAGSGLGRAYARWLAARGSKVVVNNRLFEGQPSSARIVADEIVAAGGIAVADEHSVSDPETAAAMVSATVDRFGRIDALICSAGIPAEDLRLADAPLDRLHDLMDVNFWGSLYPLRAALPAMIAQGAGRIVLTTSQAGMFGQRRGALYSASKAALIGLARATAVDVARHDININLVAPAAYTPMAASKLDPRWAEFMAPDKVAPVVAWLASADCRESGMILDTGAGRIRRARIMETPPVELDDDIAACLPLLDDMSSAVEARESYDAGRVMMPEMFAGG